MVLKKHLLLLMLKTVVLLNIFSGIQMYDGQCCEKVFAPVLFKLFAYLSHVNDSDNQKKNYITQK